MGADGWPGLPGPVRKLILDAAVLLGGARHLAEVPPRPGQRREPWPSPLRERLPALLASLSEGPVVALASGDPLVSGIGSTLIDLVGADRVRIIPAVSSVALARAELGWPAESCAVVSLVGRDAALVLRELAPGRRVLVLSADETTPGQVAGLLRAAGYGASIMHVLGHLGSDRFSRIDTPAGAWSGRAPRLNVIGLELVGPPRGAWTAGLPDALYEHDGRLTVRDLRAAALARLAPVPGEHLWDVGAGVGPIGIEWMRAHPTCTATAIEADPGRAALVGRNAANLGVPTLSVVTGTAPGALDGLPAPAAIFVGGRAAALPVVERCLRALSAGGRLVIHGATDAAREGLADLHRARGGELMRLTVAAAVDRGAGPGWGPGHTVDQWAFTRDG